MKIQMLDPDLPVPTYAKPGDAGADLVAREDAQIGPRQRIVVPTGVKIALPHGYAAFIQPRSGLAAKHGITVLNTPGLIDAGYRGEIGVILINTSDTEFMIERGDRIAQMVIQKVETPTFEVVDSLEATERGEGGFGSTGTQ